MKGLWSVLAASVTLGMAAPAWANTCYIMPFGRISSPYGDTAGRTNPHRGVDFPAGTGTPIPAIADGQVVINTSYGCLGNVIVLAHADGMFSGYSHMHVRSPLGVGTNVGRGQHIGVVGNTGTCSQGAHLHLTLGPSATSHTQGATVDPIPYINARLQCNREPIGYIDEASCEGGVYGWAFDPEAGAGAIDVHVYMGGPAGTPGIPSASTRADLRRDDLCSHVGSCEHGFRWHPPLSYHDGQPRAVHAYAINTPSGNNPQLGSSPRTFQCSPPALPAHAGGAVRRHIATPAIMDAWRLSALDISRRAQPELDAVPRSAPVSAAPSLVRIAGAPEVYVLEYGVLRHVPNPSAFSAWRLDAAAIRDASQEEAMAWIEGAPWPERPFLIKADADDVYMMDAPPPLWAELVTHALPPAIAAGGRVDATLTLRNRGSMTWTGGAVSLAATPRGDDSPLCDESWPDCAVVTPISGEIAPGEEVTVPIKLLAPLEQGTITQCFGLTLDSRWFSDEGMGGPADDTICHTFTITAPSPAGPTSPDDPADPADPTDPAAPDDPAQAPRSVEMSGGCGCDAAGGAAAPLASLLWFSVLGWRRRPKR